VEKPDRRPVVSLAGLSLIGAGAVLGLALSVPAAASSPDSPGPAKPGSAAVAEQDRPDL
jgi:hypothetical protein